MEPRTYITHTQGPPFSPGSGVRVYFSAFETGSIQVLNFLSMVSFLSETFLPTQGNSQPCCQLRAIPSLFPLQTAPDPTPCCTDLVPTSVPCASTEKFRREISLLEPTMRSANGI